MSTAYALWSRTASAATSVTVVPAAPLIACGGYVATGQHPPHVDQRGTHLFGAPVHHHELGANYQQQTANANNPYTASVAGGSTTFWRLRGASGNGGNNTVTCTAVTP